MSDEATTEQAPTRDELIDAAWARATGTEEAAPITKDDVRAGTEPEETIPDRELVAPKLADLVGAKAPEPSPLEERLARIEQALAPAPEPQETSIEAEVRELREMLMQREREAEQARQEAARQEQVSALKEGVIHNLRDAKDEYPGLLALGYEENVFNTIYQMAQAGESKSEYDVASEAEAQLRAQYEKLHAVYGQSASQEPAPSEEPSEPTPTLTPTLTSDDSPVDIKELAREGKLSRRELAELAWERTQNK